MPDKKPFIKKLDQSESDAILDKAMDALARGDEAEYKRLGLLFPISPAMANDLKESIGIEALIASGVNLVDALEAYGDGWLRA